jgi:HEAT repeat protein
VPAAVRGFSTFERVDHPELTQLLISLGEGALPAILDELARSGSLVVRKRLLEAVARQGERAVPYVLPLLDDSRWFVVRNAAFLLRKMGRSEASPLLKARMAAAQPKVLAEILKALVELKDPEWFTLLTWYLDSEDEGRRRVALEVASRIRHPDVVRCLYARLQLRVGNRLREPFTLDLIRTLGRLGDPEALPVLREILNLRQWRYRFSLAPIRREAAAAVARLEGEDARRLALEIAEGRDAGTAEAVRASLELEEDTEDEG